jgi:endo-1,4-beta-xylanase
MKYLIPQFSTLKKCAVLMLIVCTSGIYQCKSNLEEDLAPEKLEKLSPVDGVDAVAASSGGSLVNVVSGKTLKSSFPFPFGTAVVKELLEQETYTTVLNREFNSITPESSMKFKAMHTAINTYDFVKADAIVAYAQSHNMRIHGHTLIWAKDSNIPTWVLNYQGDKNAWNKLLKDHIHTVVARYKGKIASWDVVNEAINDDGTYRDNIWYRKLGESYITKAFSYAHEADPAAKLFYNDYGQEYGYHKMRTIGNIIKASRCINGVGFQMHVMVSLNTTLLKQSFKQMADAGMLVHISELDIQIKKGQPDGFLLTTLLGNLLAAKYKEIVSMYMTTVPRNLQWGITTWGISDANSYWNKYGGHNDYPLLFDGNYLPKVAYRSVIESGLENR